MQEKGPVRSGAPSPPHFGYIRLPSTNRADRHPQLYTSADRLASGTTTVPSAQPRPFTTQCPDQTTTPRRRCAGRLCEARAPIYALLDAFSTGLWNSVRLSRE